MRRVGELKFRTAWAAVLVAPLTLSSVHAQEPTEAGAAEAGPGPDAIVGIWSTEPNEGEWSHVEISKCQDRYCGRIVWLSHPLYDEAGDWGAAGDPKIDWRNPEEDLRSQPIVGMQLMHSFRLADGKWKDGRIYDPDNGKTYRSELTLADEGQLLKVRGYVRIGFVNIGRTTEWTRVSDPGG